MTGKGKIAVLDVGKTNVDLWVADPAGHLLENRSTPNKVSDGPPWRHHDLKTLGDWLGETLAAICLHHPIELLIPVGHGAGGVLVGGDPGSEHMGAMLPMIDYEESCPEDINTEYLGISGTFEDRGSQVMMASTHAARQLLLMQRADPKTFAKASHYLNIAQYWGWWLTGVAASEFSAMGAQSHLWNVPRRQWSPIVDAQSWRGLMPDFRPAWSKLGNIRPELRSRYGLPDTIGVLTGAHDSSSNYYRYIAAGLEDFTLVSTGTWVVAMSREANTATLDHDRGTTINADMNGMPVGGALVMAGREFSAIAGPTWHGDGAKLEALARIVKQGTLALPSFSNNDGQFPGSAGRGKIIGPMPETAADRTALAVLQAALLTVNCADVLDGGRRLILDGTFLKEPLYAPLVAALRPDDKTELSEEKNGVVIGALCLAAQELGGQPIDLSLKPVEPAVIPGLATYASDWRTAAEANASKAQ
ncbi:FGGY family carbohydrate kinase [uncultured Roseibium sp.]|uniref:FGGY family carbohydrate kinase n=1 Tax=uncultured Roseibium sp. TaxID=1936171 RepID=UPI00262C5972|nr:FGGY family carbohydrate kinase [uncultured Roseibium sp.]